MITCTLYNKDKYVLDCYNLNLDINLDKKSLCKNLLKNKNFIDSWQPGTFARLQDNLKTKWVCASRLFLAMKDNVAQKMDKNYIEYLQSRPGWVFVPDDLKTKLNNLNFNDADLQHALDYVLQYEAGLGQ